MLETANMLLLSKESNEKDRSLKTQFLLSTISQPTENKWGINLEKGFSQTKELISILKKKIPENALCHTKQSYLSTVKSR